MSTTGVHFALSLAQAEELFGAKDDEALLECLEQIEEKWDEGWLVSTDQAWDPIHRCLTDGMLGSENGTYPDKMTVIGGRQLYTGDDYLIAYVAPKEVEDVAASLAGKTKQAMHDIYFKIDPDDYGESLSEAGFDSMWGHFEMLRAFFAKAAGAKRPVVFTVDLIDFA